MNEILKHSKNKERKKMIKHCPHYTSETPGSDLTYQAPHSIIRYSPIATKSEASFFNFKKNILRQPSLSIRDSFTRPSFWGP